MITRITIPQAFENMEEATVGAWLKAEGDAVQIGDALCELITEKTTFSLPAEGEGVLLRIAAAEKSIVPVGAVIGLIGQANEVAPDIEAENAALRARAASHKQEGEKKEAATVIAPSAGAPSASAPPGAVPTNVPRNVPSGTSGSRVRATPAARRAARDRGVALEDVAAAFPGKVLSEDDVNGFSSDG